MAEAQLQPVDEPDLQDVKLEEGAPLSFVAVIEVRPDIALNEYKGVTVQHTTPPIEDEQVGQALDQMREQHAEFRTVERAAAPGDLVIVDYTLAPEGHDSSSATAYQFVVGGGMVLPEIDQAGDVSLGRLGRGLGARRARRVGRARPLHRIGRAAARDQHERERKNDAGTEASDAGPAHGHSPEGVCQRGVRSATNRCASRSCAPTVMRRGVGSMRWSGCHARSS